MIPNANYLLTGILLFNGVALAEGRASNHVVKVQRLLQEDVHSAHNLKSTFQWAGLFHFSPNSVYNLTVKVPHEKAEGADPHGGHVHRRLGRRSLQEVDDHADHSEVEHAEESTGEAGADFLLAIVPISNEGQEGIDEALGVIAAMEANSIVVTVVDDRDSIVPSTENAYELHFDDPEATNSLLVINVTQEHYVLFLPATPSEVSASEVHFLVDEEGVDVWPETIWLYQKPDPRDGPKPWGQVIGATLLINVVTLIGVIFLVPTLTTACKNKTVGQAMKELTSADEFRPVADSASYRAFDMCITSFACGALLATTVLLIIPEALSLVNTRVTEGDEAHDGHEGEGEKNWVFGACAMAGFLLPLFLASFFPHSQGESPPHNPVPLNGDENEEVRADVAAPSSADESVNDSQGNRQKKKVNKRLVSGIILGDSLHNFSDGVFVGASFLLCGSGFGFAVLASTMYHELAQEVSDFFLLTTQAHLPPIQALVLNFFSGLSVTLGGIIVLAINVDNFALGVILSMSSGVYINVAAKECMPVVDRLAETIKDRVIAFLFFAFGAIPIGLVLLNHKHCEAA